MGKITKQRLKTNSIWSSAIQKNQLVYAMEQVHSLKVAGATKSGSTSYSFGICLGISIRWINLRKHRKDFAHKDKICNEISTLPYLIQKKYELHKNITKALKANNLKSTSTFEMTDAVKGIQNVTPNANQFTLLCSKEHVMAVHKKGSVISFLDPNYGHFSLKGLGDFQAILRKIIRAEGYAFPYTVYKIL